jgi:ubiquinone/menaquinone biosynthesis C-methylase UbiE
VWHGSVVTSLSVGTPINRKCAALKSRYRVLSTMAIQQNISCPKHTALGAAADVYSEPTAIQDGVLAEQSCISCRGDRVIEVLVGPDRFFARSVAYRLARCASCSLVWLVDPPEAGDMARHYGPSYDRFIQKAKSKKSDQHWRSALQTVQRYGEGDTLLDLGCGSGSFLHCLRESAWNLWGIEMSEEAAEVARGRNRATILTGDILQTSLPSDTFDVITCFHVFEHMASPREVLHKVRESLKPGGIFCVHVPNIEAAEARIFRSYWYPLEPPRHLYHFSPLSLRQLARVCGLHEVSLTTAKISFVEYSMRYFLDDLLLKAGILRPSLAEAGDPTLAWRVIRKGLRLTVLPLINFLIGLTGDGSIIEAVFQKPK